MANSCAEALRLLDAGLDAATCHDFRAIREVAMCSAWDRLRAAPENWSGFGDALRDAWSRIRADCAVHGGTRPEEGFLQPAPEMPHILGVFQVRMDGVPVGVVVQEADGTLTSCVGGDCRTWPGVTAVGNRLPEAVESISGGRLTAERL